MLRSLLGSLSGPSAFIQATEDATPVGRNMLNEACAALGFEFDKYQQLVHYSGFNQCYFKVADRTCHHRIFPAEPNFGNLPN